MIDNSFRFLGKYKASSMEPSRLPGRLASRPENGFDAMVAQAIDRGVSEDAAKRFAVRTQQILGA